MSSGINAYTVDPPLGGEHGPVELEHRLVELEPLQRHEHAQGKVHGEALRQERPKDGGDKAEADQHNEEVVVVDL
jgi:hypothetical protein